MLEATVDDEVVLLGEAGLRYHGLDPVGAVVWQLLDGERTVAQICEQLLVEFDVASATCSAEVVAFLDDLAANGLISTG